MRIARKFGASIDMYRKVPLDLLDGTKRSSYLSLIALFTMVILFLVETISFLAGAKLVSNISLDSNKDMKLRVNINMTMMDLRCDYATVDIVSPLGTSLNVTSHLSKFSLDAKGVRARYSGRNQLQNDIILSDSLVVESLEELHLDGEDAVMLDPHTLKKAMEENTYLFVDFFASWCSHCQDLAPTWEVLAETMGEAAMEKADELFEHLEFHQDYSEEEYSEAVKVNIPVMIAKVDCVIHKTLCFEQQIWAYPTLRLFVNGVPTADYRGDRTVLEMVHWLANVEEYHKKKIGEEKFNVLLADEISRERLEIKETREEMLAEPGRPGQGEHHVWAEKMRKHRTRLRAGEWRDEDHPGCQISGFLWVDRVPGNFHIQARSPSHDIAAHMTNVSHEVHHLSFGEPGIEKTISRQNLIVPPKFEQTLHPLDGNVYVNYNDHEAFHHYLKIVTTEFDDPYAKSKKGRGRQKTGIKAYQLLSSSQLSYYREDIVPEAKFSYDPSPIAVYHRKTYDKYWYDYITNVMAIIGGTFTVIGMLENTIHAAISKKRR